MAKRIRSGPCPGSPLTASWRARRLRISGAKQIVPSSRLIVATVRNAGWLAALDGAVSRLGGTYGRARSPLRATALLVKHQDAKGTPRGDVTPARGCLRFKAGLEKPTRRRRGASRFHPHEPFHFGTAVAARRKARHLLHEASRIARSWGCVGGVMTKATYGSGCGSAEPLRFALQDLGQGLDAIGFLPNRCAITAERCAMGRSSVRRAAAPHDAGSWGEPIEWRVGARGENDLADFYRGREFEHRGFAPPLGSSIPRGAAWPEPRRSAQWLGAQVSGP